MRARGQPEGASTPWKANLSGGQELPGRRDREANGCQHEGQGKQKGVKREREGLSLVKAGIFSRASGRRSHQDVTLPGERS